VAQSRHWKQRPPQRGEESSSFVWRRPAKWGSSHFKASDPVPAGVARGKLTSLWDARLIERPGPAGPADQPAASDPAGQDATGSPEDSETGEPSVAEDEEEEEGVAVEGDDEPKKVGSQWELHGKKFTSRKKALQWLAETRRESLAP
jgi:hypothetical protein